MGLIRKIRSSVSSAAAPATEAAAAAKEDVSKLSARVSRGLEIMKSGRDADISALENDFSLVLDAWGMRETDISRVTREMYIRAAVYASLSVPAVLMVLSGRPIVGVAVFACACFGILTTVWRISVLTTRKYFPFPGHRLLTTLLRIKKTRDS